MPVTPRNKPFAKASPPSRIPSPMSSTFACEQYYPLVRLRYNQKCIMYQFCLLLRNVIKVSVKQTNGTHPFQSIITATQVTWKVIGGGLQPPLDF